MTDWKNYAEKRPETAGDYLAVYCPEKDGKIFVQVLHYYEMGDVLYYEDPRMERETHYQRLMDILNSNAVVAMKDGFYEVDMDHDHVLEIKPVCWMELPEPPAGYHYWKD